jgi:ATP synthase subunit 6
MIYTGTVKTPLEQFDIIIYNNSLHFQLFYTNIIYILFIIIIIYYSLLLLYNKENCIIPTIYQYIIEFIHMVIISSIRQYIGFKGYIYMPIILTSFLFILNANLISLIPFGIALTSHLIIIIFFSINMCSALFLIGIFEHKFTFFKLFVPQCPFALIPLLIIIEIFSYFLKMFSLAIRLSANIMAGHTLVYIICSFIVNVMNYNIYLISMVSLLFIIFILEFGVAFLQAYVFTVLFCIYLVDSIESSHN